MKSGSGAEEWITRALVAREFGGNRMVLWAVLCIVVAIGAWLRFHNLAEDSIWLDEAVSWQESKDGLANLIWLTAHDNYPPLHHLFLYVLIETLGDGEWSLRLPSAIFGTANIVAIYWLGSMTSGRTAGVLAALFLALCGYHVWYSQEARMYALLSLAATVFAASSVYFVKSPTIPRAALVCLAGLALLYTHPFGTFNWIAIVTAISLFTLTTAGIARRTIALWAASNFVAATGFLPWAWLLWRRAVAFNQQATWIPYPTPEFVYSTFVGMVGGQLMAALLIVGVVLALLPGAEPNSRRSWLPLFFTWTGLPVALALLISVVSNPIFFPRYVIASLPGLFLASSSGLSRYAKGWASFGLVIILSVTILAASYVIYYIPYVKVVRDNWRGVSALLDERLRPSDCLLVYRAYVLLPLSYYYRKQLPCQLLPERSAKPEVQNITSDRLFVVLSEAPPPERDQILETLRSNRWLARQNFSFGRIEVIEFDKGE